MNRRPAPRPDAVALESQLRLMWQRLEQGTPKHLYSTLLRLQPGAKPAA